MNEQICPICHEPFQHRNKIVIVKHGNDDTLSVSRKRGHYFHQDCIQQWKNHASFCPMDRDQIQKLYTVPGYQIIGLELGLYNYTYRDLLLSVNINNTLLDQLSNVDEADKDNKTLAFYACKIGNHALVCRLMKHGADFNRPCGRHGFTPLMAAVCHYHSKIVLKLLGSGSGSGSVYDTTGNTAFSYACQTKQLTIIREFIVKGLVNKHQVLYCLDLYRKRYAEDGKRGQEIITTMCAYLKTDSL